MKRVININFQGRVVPIEETAYEMLKKYVESLNQLFVNEEGKEEIINDIEGRIAELFAETLKKGSPCISDNDMNNIINSMGRPEDFEIDEAAPQQPQNNAQNNSQSNNANNNTNNTYSQYTTNNNGKKLYRDETNKVFAGVCGGVAKYFNIDPLVVRILTVILVSFTLIPYIVIWIAVPGSASIEIGGQRKRLFKDIEDKIIAGVCSGMGHYFGINAWIPRILFLLPFFSFAFKWSHSPFFSLPHFFKFTFSPASLIIYIILWIVLPDAITSADKLEMRGEKVDLNSIKETIQNDMKGVGKRVEAFGEEIAEKAQNLGKLVYDQSTNSFKRTNGTDATNTYAANLNKNNKSLGDVLMIIMKVFAYFIVGCILFALFAGLFSLGIVFTGFLPLKDYLVRNGWQNLSAWGTLIFFIWLPIVALLVFVIRRITKSKKNNPYLRYSFTVLWIAGWVSVFFFLSSLFSDFQYKNTINEEAIVLINKNIDKLNINNQKLNKFGSHNFFALEPFASMDEDTIYVRNIWIKIEKSNDQFFHVTKAFRANGNKKIVAQKLAENIQFNITQADSNTLILDKGIAINKTDKFRNQQVIITVYVPVGKKIEIENLFKGKYGNRCIINDEKPWKEYDDEDNNYDYDYDTEYIMTSNGLKRTDNFNEKIELQKEFDHAQENLKQDIQDAQQQIKDEMKELEDKIKERNDIKKAEQLELQEKLQQEIEDLQDKINDRKEKLNDQLKELNDMPKIKIEKYKDGKKEKVNINVDINSAKANTVNEAPFTCHVYKETIVRTM